MDLCNRFAMVVKHVLTDHIIDPLHPLVIREVDPGGQVSATQQPVQVFIAHVLNGLSSALLL